MNRDKKIKIYIFVSVVLFFIIPTPLIFLWYECSPQGKRIFQAVGSQVELTKGKDKFVGTLQKAQYNFNDRLGFIDLQVTVRYTKINDEVVQHRGGIFQTYIRPWQLDNIKILAPAVPPEK